METLPTTDPLARRVVDAIRRGDLVAVRAVLAEHSGLAAARVGDDDPGGMSRSLLHVATDWPGHPPHVAETIAALVDAGADVNARFRGRHGETPLHWAASSDDVAAIGALLDAGADLEAGGAVIAGGSPLRDATAFGQWRAAAMLVARGAHVTAFDAATLGLTDQLTGLLESGTEDVSHLFWAACHGGRLETSRFLHGLGADPDVVPPWQAQTPLDGAARQGAHDVITWLRSIGAHTHSELVDC